MIGGQGYQGFQGIDGQFAGIGAQGYQGVVGAQGIQGYQGYQGTLGNQGLTGRGSQGVQGFQGLDGQFAGIGAQGYTGPQGPAGSGGGGTNATTTITMSVTYTLTSSTQYPLGNSTLTGINIFNTPLPPNLQISVSGNSLLITNSKPLPSNNIEKQQARAYLTPLAANLNVLSNAVSGTTSVSDPNKMFYNSTYCVTGVLKYPNITYSSTTIGSFNVNLLFDSSNGFLGASNGLVGKLDVAEGPGVQFIGLVLSLTFNNSVL